jgi:hypothetical protein
MITTDPDGLVADTTVNFSIAEWEILEEVLNGWEHIKTHIANPNYDPDGPVDNETNPPTIPAATRWQVNDLTEASFERHLGAILTKRSKEVAIADRQARADAAKANKLKSDAGDDVPVRVDRNGN